MATHTPIMPHPKETNRWLHRMRPSHMPVIAPIRQNRTSPAARRQGVMVKASGYSVTTMQK